jgi:hypothetical protein
MLQERNCTVIPGCSYRDSQMYVIPVMVEQQTAEAVALRPVKAELYWYAAGKELRSNSWMLLQGLPNVCCTVMVEQQTAEAVALRPVKAEL